MVILTLFEPWIPSGKSCLKLMSPPLSSVSIFINIDEVINQAV